MTAPSVLLGRCVAARPELHGIAHRGSYRPSVIAIFACDAEVDDLHEAIGLEHDVGGFHVTVDDRGRTTMQVLKCIAQLEPPVDYLVFGLRPIGGEYGGKRTTFDIIHDHIEGAVFVH